MLLILCRALSLLPLRALQIIGRFGGLLVYGLPGRYRQRLQKNAREAGYTEPAFARRAAAQAGEMFMELPRVWFKAEQCLSLVTSTQDHVLKDALNDKRGVLFLTPHLGNFDMAARHGARHQGLTVMFRPPRKAMLAPLLEAGRNAKGVRAVPANRQGVREFLRALKNGEAVGMLPDQVPREGDGVWAPFFGREALTVTLPGRLATQANAIVIVAACERLPRGAGWRMHYVRAPEPLPSDARAQATLINQIMESLIVKFPEQYLWSYDRYKRPRNAPPPPGGAA